MRPSEFMHAEDTDLCWEIARLGKRIVYQPAAVIVHHGAGVSFGEFSRFSCLQMNLALHRLIVSRQGKWGGLAYRALMAFPHRCAWFCSRLPWASPTGTAAPGDPPRSVDGGRLSAGPS